MGRQVGETIESCVVAVGDKLLRREARRGGRAGRSQRAVGKEVLTVDAGQALMLKQLKGKIDLMSDLMAKEERRRCLSRRSTSSRTAWTRSVKSRELQDKLKQPGGRARRRGQS